MTEEELNDLTRRIIGVAIEVHQELGPGLLESVYQRCLKIALEDSGFHVQMEVPIPVRFRGRVIDEDGYRLDLLVDHVVVLELKSVLATTPVFEKQVQTYLRLADKPCGLLFNFNSARLVDGIKRIRNGYLPSVNSVSLCEPPHLNTEQEP
ncbi:MAG: GxxExxY protein [Kiritimatiellia bacterium]|jgi:GxxExxY protein